MTNKLTQFWNVVDYQLKKSPELACAIAVGERESSLLAYGHAVLRGALEITCPDRNARNHLLKTLDSQKPVKSIDSVSNWSFGGDAKFAKIERDKIVHLCNIFSDGSVHLMDYTHQILCLLPTPVATHAVYASLQDFLEQDEMVLIDDHLFPKDHPLNKSFGYGLSTDRAKAATASDRRESITICPLSIFAFPEITEDEAVLAIQGDPELLIDCLLVLESSDRLYLEATLSALAMTENPSQMERHKQAITDSTLAYKEALIDLVTINQLLFNPTDCAGFRDFADAVRAGLKARIKHDDPVLAAQL